MHRPPRRQTGTTRPSIEPILHSATNSTATGVGVAQGKDSVAAAAEKVNSALAPLKPEERRRVLDSAYALWGGSGPAPTPGTGPGPVPAPLPVAAGGGAAPSPGDFMDRKAPRTGVERIACLGYYLTRYRNKPKLKTKDLEDLNSEARQPPIPNAPVVADNATKGGAQFLSSAGGGLKQVTTRGSAFVEVLPDRTKANEALAIRPLVRRHRRRRVRAGRGN